MTDSSPLDLVETFLSTVAPRRTSVTVCARNDLVERHTQLVEDLDALDQSTSGGLATPGGEGLSERAETLLGQLAEVQAEQEASTLNVELQGIGAEAWADLLRLHPPLREHRGYAHNPHTFPPAAVAACSATPKITEGQAARMYATLHSAEWTKLWVAVVKLNETETPRPKLAAATDLLLAKPPSAGSQEPMGSLAEPS